ncbi:MAG TPA: nicotinate phosphoribosyltransferase [Bacteroidales bacterium]|nr:nicotinate phosphoribosyltransferase [Bacteroidales bacterium]
MQSIFNGKFVDFYELTMAQGYFLSGRYDEPATFDYFFRKNPFGGGYTVFAGLSDFLDALKNFTFSAKDCTYLSKKGLDDKFLKYLKSFSFKGTIHSVQEGEIVFPQEPVMRIEGNILETQLIETLLLNILNFQSLIATKASRIKQAAGNRTLLDFGLRRAQGLGGLSASKAAITGGFNGTSNVQSAYDYNLNATGTMAHSWIQSYAEEEEAFRDFARFFPDNCILLIDTYDTLKSGIKNAVKIAKELEGTGKKMKGIRLDSGDLAYLSKKCRAILNQHHLDYVKIFTSNQLDEFTIKSLLEQSAPIDGFGVGTNLVTGRDDAALDGVYKLSMFKHKPQIKTSDNIEKQTLPGNKKIIRYFDDHDQFYADAIALDEEEKPEMIIHPYHKEKTCKLKGYSSENLLQKVYDRGKKMTDDYSVEQTATYVKKRLLQFPDEHKRFENPHIYKVGISRGLVELRSDLIQQIQNNYHKKEEV